MSNVSPIAEANLVDLTDDELRAYLLATHEAVKNLEEQKSKDPDIEQMKQRLKDYTNDNYNEAIKTHKAKLKAARAHAKGRKLSIKLPGDK